jgi:hypothetical protein
MDASAPSRFVLCTNTLRQGPKFVIPKSQKRDMGHPHFLFDMGHPELVGCWLLLWRILGLQDLLGLPQVAAFVGQEGAEAGGEAEAGSGDEGISIRDSGEVEVGVGVEEGVDFFLRVEEIGGGLGEGDGGRRLDDFGCFDFSAGFYGWFKEAYKDAADDAWFRCAAAHLLLCPGCFSGGDHVHQIGAVGDGYVIEAAGDAPGAI